MTNCIVYLSVVKAMLREQTEWW